MKNSKQKTKITGDGLSMAEKLDIVFEILHKLGLFGPIRDLKVFACFTNPASQMVKFWWLKTFLVKQGHLLVLFYCMLSEFACQLVICSSQMYFFGITCFSLLHFGAWLHIICDWDLKISEQPCVKCTLHMMHLCKTNSFLPKSKNPKSIFKMDH